MKYKKMQWSLFCLPVTATNAKSDIFVKFIDNVGLSSSNTHTFLIYIYIIQHLSNFYYGFCLYSVYFKYLP